MTLSRSAALVLCAALAATPLSAQSLTGSQQPLTGPLAGERVTPVATVGADGSVLAAWEEKHRGLYVRPLGEDLVPLSEGSLVVASDEIAPLPFRGRVRAHRDPQLATTRDGALLVWTEELDVVSADIFFERHDARGRRVLVQRLNARGTAVGSVREVSAGDGFHARPVLASRGNGAVVVWERRFGKEAAGVFARLLAADGTPQGQPIRVDEGSGARPAVAVLRGGGFVVVWEECCDAGGDRGIFGRFFARDGSAATPVLAVNGETFGDQRLPVVAANRLGRVFVAWQGPADGELDVIRVFGRRLAESGRLVGGELALSSGPGDDHSNPALVAGGAGDFLALWFSWEGPFRTAVMASSLRGNGRVGEAVQVSESVIDGQFEIGTAAAPDGSYLALWEGYLDTAEHTIMARRVGESASRAAAECLSVLHAFSTAGGDAPETCP
jgi:hypothetical protein